MFETLTGILASVFVLIGIILIILLLVNIVLWAKFPKAFSVLKWFESLILRGEGKVLKRFGKQLTILIVTAFCSTLLVDNLLPDYYHQFFNIRALYALLTFVLINATIITHYRFKTDRTWFLRTAIASATTLSAAVLYYNYLYPAYTVILPVFSSQTQTLLMVSAASLVAAVITAAGVWAFSWKQNHSKILERSGFDASMEFLSTGYRGATSSKLNSSHYEGENNYYGNANAYGVHNYGYRNIESSGGVYWLRVMEIPESHQNKNMPEETNPRTWESGRMISALAQSGIHFGLLVKFHKGNGEIYYNTRGRNNASILEGVLSTFHPGLTCEEQGVSLGSIRAVAVVEVRSGYPRLQNILEHILEYFAQTGCTGVVYAVVKPYGSLGRLLTKRSKKGRYREIQNKGENIFDPQVELDAIREGYALTRGDVKAGLYVAVTADIKEIAKSRAENLASFIRGAFGRNSNVKVVCGGGAERRLKGMFALKCVPNLDLTFSEAEALAHVPKIEVGGTKIRKTVMFSQNLPDVPLNEGVLIGHLIRNGKVLLDRPIVLLPDILKKHFNLTGLSGSGKTMMALVLLSELGLFSGISRFVIEMEKREYRKMLLIEEETPLIFPIGESDCRFRYNPLYVYPKETVSQKISDLIWILNHYFVLYAPMDTMLEIALNLTYEEKGWDVKGDARGETPTLLDLCSAIEVAMEALDYHEEAKKNIRTGLLARISTLCTGALGTIFLCKENTPFELLRDRLVVFELEGVGKQTKPFTAFLTLHYLYQNIKQQEPSDNLEGVILVEEAHAIFKKQPVNPDSDSRAPQLASEFLQDLFRTMRSQGWGLGVADQNPTNLPDEVAQNCSTFIAGKSINANDREYIAKCMGLNEKQSEVLKELKPGEYIILLEEGQTIHGRGRNLKVEFPELKEQIEPQVVTERMVSWYRENGILPADSSRVPSQIEFFEAQRRVRELLGEIRLLVLSREFAKAYLELVNSRPEMLEEYLTALSAELAGKAGFEEDKVFHYLRSIAKGRYQKLN